MDPLASSLFGETIIIQNLISTLIFYRNLRYYLLSWMGTSLSKKNPLSIDASWEFGSGPSWLVTESIIMGKKYIL